MNDHVVSLRDEAHQQLQQFVASGTRRCASLGERSDQGFTDEEIVEH